MRQIKEVHLRKLLLIYASQTGKTAAMAASVREGILRHGDEVELRFIEALNAGIDDLLWCEGLLIGTPENFGYMAGAVKDFFDRTYYPAQDKVAGLPYVIFVNAGNDGRGAVSAIERIAKGYGWRLVDDPMIVHGDVDASVRKDCADLGEAFAIGLVSGIY